MSDDELLEGIQKDVGEKKYAALDKRVYEQALARFLWGFVRAAIVAFVVGKLVGYFGFLSWWYIAAPLVICLFGAVMNFAEWVPNIKILLYTVGAVYMILRYAILRLILWLPMFLALFTGFCIVKRYGSDWGDISIAIVATIATYLMTVYLSGRSPGMPA